MSLVHEDYIEEKGIVIKELPKGIQDKISKINEKLDAYDELESDEGDVAYNEIMNMSEDIKSDLEKLDKNPSPKKEEEEKEEDSDFDENGISIDKELHSMFESGKTDYTSDEVKQKAPKTYDVIFEEYSVGGENGVATSNYSLIEVTEHNYTLKKIN